MAAINAARIAGKSDDHILVGRKSRTDSFRRRQRPAVGPWGNPNHRLVKTHRSYTVEEVARRFGTDGRYDAAAGRFVTPAGEERHLVATDHLDHPSLRGLRVEDLFDLLARTGLSFDQARQTGVVFHMLSALTTFGRVGMTAIGAHPGGRAGASTTPPSEPCSTRPGRPRPLRRCLPEPSSGRERLGVQEGLDDGLPPAARLGLVRHDAPPQPHSQHPAALVPVHARVVVRGVAVVLVGSMVRIVGLLPVGVGGLSAHHPRSARPVDGSVTAEPPGVCRP